MAVTREIILMDVAQSRILMRINALIAAITEKKNRFSTNLGMKVIGGEIVNYGSFGIIIRKRTY